MIAKSRKSATAWSIVKQSMSESVEGMVRRLATLLILVLMLTCSVLRTVGCEEGDSTGPVVNNSGDNNAFDFSDDSNG